jgi:hypothetical protein
MFTTFPFTSKLNYKRDYDELKLIFVSYQRIGRLYNIFDIL